MELSKYFLTTLLIILSPLSLSSNDDRSNVEALGLFDHEHTKTDGSQHSYLHSANELGYITGFSNRFSGSTQIGESAWVYNGESIKRLGLFDELHTGRDHTQKTFLRSLNNAGHVAGYSQQYKNNKKRGHSAWVYNGLDMIPVGLTGSIYLDKLGYSDTTITALNNNSEAVGYNKIFSGNRSYLTDTWIFSGGMTRRIGLSSKLLSSDVIVSNKPFMINDSGLVVGSASIYKNTDGKRKSSGHISWMHDGVNTFQIGLTDIEHTRDDGYQFSLLRGLNEQGIIAGNSKRFDSGKEIGMSAWIHNNGVIKKIGLYSPSYTRGNGYQYNIVNHLSEKGHVAGTGYLFEGNKVIGQTAWLYDGVNTIPIGLQSESNVRNDGYRDSSSFRTNSQGVVTGKSKLYSGDKEKGMSVWVYNNNHTQRVGLFDQLHTRMDGYQKSNIWKISDTNLVLGSSERYEGNIKRGETVWVFSIADQKMHVVYPDVEESYYSDVKALTLGDNGLVLGYFSIRNDDSETVRKSAFSFSIRNGFKEIDLSSVDSENEIFSSLSSAKYINQSGHIIGNGVTKEGYSAVYLLRRFDVADSNGFRVILTGALVFLLLIVGLLLTGRKVS